MSTLPNARSDRVHDAKRTASLVTSSASHVGALPFLKWVGGKRRLLPALRARLPADLSTRRYVEPFVGGGALFFALQPGAGVLADLNGNLVETYRIVRDAPELLIAHLEFLERRHSHDAFYQARERYNTRAAGPGPVERAALFIYLNKTCFNGLYRVNRQGLFNAPIGRYAKPCIVDAARLRAASAALQRVELRHAAFGALLDVVQSNDFLYLDPPYVPLTRTASFTAYGPAAFSMRHQESLHAVVTELDARGAKLLLSNSDTPWVRERYRHFHIETVTAPRAINCAPHRRGAVPELLIRNYEGTYA
ncbi:MAG TPA: DNA adenine methylase [Polyangiales bacterium]|nr:DNA adenine methylase [Polyangiales bacterium]